jgi:hypothetical protein
VAISYAANAIWIWSLRHDRRAQKFGQRDSPDVAAVASQLARHVNAQIVVQRAWK